MEECIFCKIYKKELPSHKVYENEFIYAFLDINPSNEGHTLIIPKTHQSNFSDLNEDFAKEMNAAALKVMNQIKKSEIKADGFNLLLNESVIAGQEVMHAHLHVIPRVKSDTHKKSFYVDERARKQLNKTCELLKF